MRGKQESPPRALQMYVKQEKHPHCVLFSPLHWNCSRQQGKYKTIRPLSGPVEFKVGPDDPPPARHRLLSTHRQTPGESLDLTGMCKPVRRASEFAPTLPTASFPLPPCSLTAQRTLVKEERVADSVNIIYTHTRRRKAVHALLPSPSTRAPTLSLFYCLPGTSHLSPVLHLLCIRFVQFSFIAILSSS